MKKPSVSRLSPGNLRGLRQLAGAYAAVGRFPEAAATAREAADLAAAQGDKEMAELIGKRLEAYQAGKPYREAGR